MAPFLEVGTFIRKIGHLLNKSQVIAFIVTFTSSFGINLDRACTISERPVKERKFEAIFHLFKFHQLSIAEGYFP